jgi:hypothetical protein
MNRAGSILVGVLWCMVLLSVLVIGVLHTARMDLLVVKNYGDRVQAHYLALAAVERAKALIFQDVVTRQQTAKNHTGSLYNDAKDFQDVSLGRGKFRVFRRASPEDGGGILYGISDEESRLNLNVVPANQLTNLDGMTPDMVGAIMAWRTPATQNPAAQNNAAQNSATLGGANSDYYLSLRPPCLPRNGPFQTVRELLMVRGVTPELLLGNDVNQNGFLDTGQPGPRRRQAASPAPSGLGLAADGHGHGQERERFRQGSRQSAIGRRSHAHDRSRNHAADCQSDHFLPGPEPVANPGRSSFRHGAKPQPGRKQRRRRQRGAGRKPAGRAECFGQFRSAGDQPGIAGTNRR